MSNFYRGTGIVRYKPDGWVIVECPISIVNYYKWWIEKFTWKKISTSFHRPHITVVAAKHEPARDLRKWKNWDGKEVTFQYSSTIYSNRDVLTSEDIAKGHGRYFWLVVECPAAAKIREELGLKPNLKWPYHLTIGYLGY